MSKKKRSIFLLAIIVLLITVGFALLTATLKINFSGSLSRGIWDIHWENVDNEAGVEPVSPATILPSDDKTVEFEADFTIPGDYYEFTVDAVNKGTIDGMLKKVEPTINGTNVNDIEDYLECSVTYLDGTLPVANDLLGAGKFITYKVRLEYKRDITNELLEALPNDGEPYVIGVKIYYDQANENAIDRGNTSVYHIFKLGDYFEMQPDKEQATTTIAGFDGSTLTEYQKLWRVIKLNDDGSVDAVSEYTSRSAIKIFTVDGFKNLVAGMNDLATCYAKDGYTTKTRMMGYGGQTAVISDASQFDGSLNPRDNSDVSPPSRQNTPHPLTGTGEEFQGGVIGDTLYLKDIQLVSNVYKSESRYGANGLKAGTSSISNTGNFSGTIYWLASRGYRYNSSYMCFDGNAIDASGNMYEYCIRSWFSGSWTSGTSGSYRVRPIITLGSKVQKGTGEGTRDNPYTLE